jgi:hypothetical protein
MAKLVDLLYAWYWVVMYKNKGCVIIVALPFTLNSILRQKKKKNFMKTQIFMHAKNIIFKKSSKRNKNPSRYVNSITNLKSFNTSQNIIFQKILI